MQFSTDSGLLVLIPSAGLNLIKTEQNSPTEPESSRITSPCTHASSCSLLTDERTQGCTSYLPRTYPVNNEIRSTLFKAGPVRLPAARRVMPGSGTGWCLPPPRQTGPMLCANTRGSCPGPCTPSLAATSQHARACAAVSAAESFALISLCHRSTPG